MSNTINVNHIVSAQGHEAVSNLSGLSAATSHGATDLPVAAVNAVSNQADSTSVLFQNQMPVWLSLLLVVAAAVGTYFLTPRITRRIEIDKARSAHVVSAINRVNDDVVKLMRAIRQFIAVFHDKPMGVSEARGTCLDIIAETQWRLIDLKVILPSKLDHGEIDAIGDKLLALKRAVQDLKADGDQETVVSEVGQISEGLKGLLDKLYREAKLYRESWFTRLRQQS